MKHRWTFQEDYVCCTYYLRYIFNKPAGKSVRDLIYDISLELTELESGSIRMKLQNIKQICMEYDFEDGMDISPLEKYSYQCKRAFLKAITDFNDELKAKKSNERGE